MKREAFKAVGNPLLMGGPVLFSRVGDSGDVPVGPGLTPASAGGAWGYVKDGTGALVPSTVDNVEVEYFLNLDADGLELAMVGGQLPGKDTVIVEMPGLAGSPFTLTWNPTFSSYVTVSGAVGAEAYMVANVGITVPLELTAVPGTTTGTHIFRIGSGGAAVGFYADIFGGLLPDTLSGSRIEYLQANASGTLQLEAVGGVQIAGSSFVTVEVTPDTNERPPAILTWNPSFNDYRLSGRVDIWDFLLAGVGTSIAIKMVSENTPLDDQVEAILAGTKGFALDPKDFSTLSQNAAGTIPVTANGQPIGRINGKWGIAPVTYQANNDGAARPALSADGMVFDGVDDLLRSPVPVDTFRDVPGAGITTRLIPGGTGVFAYFSQDVAAGERVGGRASANVNLRLDRAPIDGGTNTRQAPAGVITPGVPVVLTSSADFITDRFLRTFLDGVQIGTGSAMLTAAGNSSDTASAIAHIGRPSTTNNFYVGTIGRMIFYPFALTPEQRAIFEAWVAE